MISSNVLENLQPVVSGTVLELENFNRLLNEFASSPLNDEQEEMASIVESMQFLILGIIYAEQTNTAVDDFDSDNAHFTRARDFIDLWQPLENALFARLPVNDYQAISSSVRAGIIESLNGHIKTLSEAYNHAMNSGNNENTETNSLSTQAGSTISQPVSPILLFTGYSQIVITSPNNAQVMSPPRRKANQQ